MKALCWHGKGSVEVNEVPDPSIEDDSDVIVKVTSTAICGSDLHLFNGFMPTMKSGDVLGHEFMGEIVDVGKKISKVKVGDRVVVPFHISCGECFFCKREEFSACDRTNPNADMARTALGQSPAAMFGYSHMMGGIAGGQAEYVRVPRGDVGPFKIETDLKDEQVLFLTDIFPTGYMAAENCNIQEGDTVAIWGCGPVAQFAIRSALLLGAGKVVAIDRVTERLAMAKVSDQVITINFEKEKVYDRLMEITGGRGPDSCIDCVGCEAHSATTILDAIDTAREALYMSSNRNYVLNEMIQCCRKTGTLSIPGVYTSVVNGVLIGALMNKGLTVKTGQTHVHRYLEPLLKTIQDKKIDPSFVVTHRISLEEAPEAYQRFRDHQDGCIKVVMKP